MFSQLTIIEIKVNVCNLIKYIIISWLVSIWIITTYCVFPEKGSHTTCILWDTYIVLINIELTYLASFLRDIGYVRNILVTFNSKNWKLKLWNEKMIKKIFGWCPQKKGYCPTERGRGVRKLRTCMEVLCFFDVLLVVGSEIHQNATWR